LIIVVRTAGRQVSYVAMLISLIWKQLASCAAPLQLAVWSVKLAGLEKVRYLGSWRVAVQTGNAACMAKVRPQQLDATADRVAIAVTFLPAQQHNDAVSRDCNSTCHHGITSGC
jgi:hypothetical protein